MKKKLLAAMMAATMVATSLGGAVTVFAEEEAASTDYDVENREYNDVTITIHTRWDEADVSGPLYQAIVDGFMEEYPGITVECINIPTESEWLNSESVLMSDPASMPNILQEYGGSRMAGYIEQNLIVNMDPYYEQYPEWEERFNSLGTSLVDYSSFGYEGTYGVPFTAYQIELFYNEDILNENGIDPASIKSWDDLMAACETLKANGVQPFEMGEMDDYRFGHLHSMLNYKTYGCEVAEQLGSREMTYDSEEQIAIYNMIKEAVDKGYLGTNLLGNDDGQERSIFNTGGCAFLFMGTWYCAEDHSGLELFENEKIHAMRFPYVNEEYELDDMGGGNEGYYVVDTGDPDEVAASVLFLKYMTREDVVNTFVEGYPIPMSVNVTSDAGNYLVKEANAIIAETEDVRGDIENYDSATHMINTVRQALQGLAMGQTAEEVGQRIVEMIAQYE
ncbi:MAG TPA: extracellular solute-binding protein [Candidatus Blautia faecigallinarum]|uniref:Extracellular solute-binding protein n=1 Tax=Candidatus Blautia faecigallinarum TaxID=2838488 RepID=A0A9D2DSA2_9FIRM|nr:extracellular solute-binding protein [Candidatus Blautia faecigallinarum]